MSLSKTSPAKRRANRLNALHSTGPRSQQGKERSALNSKKYGLSIPISLPDDDPKVAAIMRILQEEGYDEVSSYEIAICILEHDRVMKAIRSDYLDRVEVSLSDLYNMERVKELPGRAALMVLRSMLDGKPMPVERVQKSIAVDDAKRARQHQRYLKRAAAQLNKAIRRG